ncbi:hypothetical protein AC579_8719 [Pseudocercospora musae]|uniref:Uncharacterized protein n=1 Tax=Pseudocercospora musae TaxID=113226 RepID=A0A139IW95_9PEZI|nr:hypothetical protein AC579_8719 [Pseudocercospora musae]
MSYSRYDPDDTSDSETEPKYEGASARQYRRSSSDHRIATWTSGNEEQDFYHRTLVPQYRYVEQGGRYAASLAQSDTFSTAMTRGSNYDSMASSRTPSLISSNSTRRASESSARTDSIASMPNQYILEEDDDGTLVAPASRRGTLQCPLAFLGCEEWFDDAIQWEAHHRSHYRDRLPRSIDCSFRGCGQRFREQTSQEAWTRRWTHIVSCSCRTSGVDARASSSLVEYLWRIGVISSAQEQVHRQSGSLSTSGAYLESHSVSRDRRRERRAEDYRSPRSARHGGGGGGGAYVLQR